LKDINKNIKSQENFPIIKNKVLTLLKNYPCEGFGLIKQLGLDEK